MSKKFGLTVVEDAAEALGSWSKGRHLGGLGRCGILSFNGNKILTTGGGGMLVTNNAEIAQLARHISTTAKKPHKWRFEHDDVGMNARLPNINAALGVSQMHRLQLTLDRKAELHARYANAFKDCFGFSFLDKPDGSQSNFWLETIVLDEPDTSSLNHLLSSFWKSQIPARPVWKPLHLQEPYSRFPRAELSNTTRASKKIINLPSSHSLVENR